MTTNLPETTEPPATGGARLPDKLTIERAHEDGYPWVPEWKGVFLRNLRLMPNVSAAARLAGIARQYAYQVRDEDPLFRLVWDDAVETAVDAMERFAHTMATMGMETTETRSESKSELIDGAMVVVEQRTVTTAGRLVSPQMAMFLLSAHRPEKFSRAARLEHTGKGGAPIQVDARVWREPDAERALELARIAVELGPDDVEHGEAVEIPDEEVPADGSDD